MIHSLLIAVVIVCSLLSLLLVFFTYLVITKVRKLSDLKPPEPKDWPRVSLIIPAKDEEDTIESAVMSRLEDNYPNLEIILIDDRSDDTTRDLIKHLAEQDKRIKTVFIDELPEGWIGKTWAMEQGVSVSKGDFILFSDADVHHSKGTLKKTISLCEAENIDHLGILPHLGYGTFPLNTVIAGFYRLFPIQTRIWAVDDPQSKAHLGIGAFNLVRRSAFNKTMGFEWLKMEPIDDIGLGLLMKNSGAKCMPLHGCEDVMLDWYSDLSGFVSAVERSGISAYGGYSILKTIGIGIAAVVMDFAPFLAFAFSGIKWLPFLGGAAVISTLGSTVAMSKWTNRRILPAFFQHLGILITGYCFIRSAILGKIRGGIYWRDTFYPISELREAKRVKF